jgi:ubiquinone biosynthesis protein COQ4
MYKVVSSSEGRIMMNEVSKLDFPRGIKALRALFADPDDLPQVFVIIESLAGATLDRMEERMKSSASGRRLLESQPDITEKLKDRAWLRSLPEGSLGRAYLAFVESENISAEGIIEADIRGSSGEIEVTPNQAFLQRRMRDTHDLWHAVLGYKGDVLGEASILGFTLAQGWNLGIALIVGLGLVKTYGKPAARDLILDGFRRGRRAAWFPAQEWESMLALPVTEVRTRLLVSAPPVYTPVRSSELKMAAAAA